MKDMASLNMSTKLVTKLVCHALMDWLNAAAFLNMFCIVVTASVRHELMSGLHVG